MKKQLRRFLSRVSKYYKKYKDGAWLIEIKLASNYKRLKRKPPK